MSNIETDCGFGVYQEQIEFLNFDDCKIKIVPFKDQNQNTLLYLTIISENCLFENLKYTCTVNLNEEYEKQKNFDLVFQDLELNVIGSNFAQYFQQQQYQFLQNAQNQAQLLINSKMMIGPREREIQFQFQFLQNVDENQENQSTEKIISNLQKSLVKEQKKNQKFQEEVLNQNKQTFEMLQQMQQLIIQNIEQQNQEIEQLTQSLDEFQQQTNEKLENDNKNQIIYNDQLQTITKQCDFFKQKFEGEIRNCQNQQLQRQQQQGLNKFYQEVKKIQNKPEPITNPLSGLSLMAKQTFSLSDYLEKKPKSIYQIKQFFECKRIDTYDLDRYVQRTFGENICYLDYKKKLKECCTLFKGDDLMSIACMLPQKFEDKLNPKQVLRDNLKNLSVQEFKEKCQNINNCLILTKIKQKEDTFNSQAYCQGGYCPDSIIFDTKGNGRCKTLQSDEDDYPFTFDLQKSVKRRLISKDDTAYKKSQNKYFEFGDNYWVDNENQYSYAETDENYTSIDREENLDQKVYKQSKVYDIEIEVIQLL